jgi:hypothetical protein
MVAGVCDGDEEWVMGRDGDTDTVVLGLRLADTEVVLESEAAKLDVVLWETDDDIVTEREALTALLTDMLLVVDGCTDSVTLTRLSLTVRVDDSLGSSDVDIDSDNDKVAETEALIVADSDTLTAWESEAVGDNDVDSDKLWLQDVESETDDVTEIVGGNTISESGIVLTVSRSPVLSWPFPFNPQHRMPNVACMTTHVCP